ncbi:MAG: choice-of-anchor D domain-containing protein [Bacteroidetes bacterium]|nr:choice-of-anchor D domain-containing protein [Bacteroidota bacterium]
MRNRLLPIFTILFFAKTAFAQQVYPVSLTGLLIPPHSLDLSVYGTQRSQDLVFTAALTDPIELYRDTRLKLYFENNGKTLYTTDPNANFTPIRLNMNQPVQLDGFALQPYLQPEALLGAAGQGQGSVIVPEGLNRICVEVIDLERNVPISRKTCVTGGFFLNEPPLLQLPACGGNVPQTNFQNQTFTWTPLHSGSGNNPAPVEYLFQLVEIQPGVDPNDGFDFSLKILERITMSPSLIYGPTDPILQPGHIYAWRVQARNMLKPGLLFRNNGFSQVCTFIYGDGFVMPGGEMAAEAAEEERVAPQGCEVFDTDFGPIFSQDYTPAAMQEGDTVKVGWFNLVVTNIFGYGDGANGFGFIKIPMLNAAVQVSFTGLKVKPNTNRCYAVESIVATDDTQFFTEMQNGGYPVEGYFQQLQNDFENGRFRNQISSQLDLNGNPIPLPIGIQNEQSPNMVVVNELRFTPRNAYMTCTAYQVNEDGSLNGFGPTEIPITPYGVKNGARLKVAQGGGATGVYAGIFLTGAGGETDKTGMNLDCGGFKSLFLDTEFTVDSTLMKTADGTPVHFRLASSKADPVDYLGGIKKFDGFTLPKLPGYQFSMKNGQLDLSEVKKIGQNKLAVSHPETGQDNWQGLYLDDVSVTFPPSFNLLGDDKQIQLDQGSFALDATGGQGHFYKKNLLSLDKGRMGTWPYSVDSLQMRIAEGEMERTWLTGQVKLPLLDEPFPYSGEFNLFDEDKLQIQLEQGQRTMSLWSGKMQVTAESKVEAEMKDFGTAGKELIPSAKLAGLFSMSLSSSEFDKYLTGDKAVIKNRLRGIFGYNDHNPKFELNNLDIKELVIDPYQLPSERYKLLDYSIAEDGLKIEDVPAKLGEARIRYTEQDSAGNEELALELIVKQGNEIVQFSFIARMSASGNFELNRIEVQTEGVQCDCHAYVPFDRNNVEGIGQMLERVYDKFYAPDFSATQSAGSLASAGDFSSELLQNAHKKALLTEMESQLFGGFPIVDDVLTIDFLGVQLSMEQNGSDWSAAKSIERSSANFTFENIDALPVSGERRLPINLTPDLLTKMGITNTALPDNARLLISDFRVEGGTSYNASNTKVEFTLLVKMNAETYAQFVRKDVKVSPTSVDMADFYLLLDADVKVKNRFFDGTADRPGGIRLLKNAPASGKPSESQHSYAYMTCVGFHYFNVQGEYAVPFKGNVEFPEGKLKLRDLEKDKPKEAESQLKFAFVVHQKTELGKFIAGVRQKTTDGKVLNFVGEGAEGLILKAGESNEIYLDFDPDKNQKGLHEYAGPDFMGLYFNKINVEIEGLSVDEAGGNVEVEIADFHFSPVPNFGFNGLGGAFRKEKFLPYEQKKKLGGWQYSVDFLEIDFDNAWKNDNQPAHLEGKLRCPLFKDDEDKNLFSYAGNLSFERSKDKDGKFHYHPSAAFGIDGVDPEFVYKADWIPGMTMKLDGSSTVSLDWVELEGQPSGFLPSVELNGTSDIAFKRSDPSLPQALKDMWFDLEFKKMEFSALKINKSDSEGTPISSNAKLKGIRTLSMGTWGGSEDASDNIIGFPVWFDKPKFVYDAAKYEFGLTIQVQVNLSPESMLGSVGNEGKLGTDLANTATTANAFYQKNDKLEDVLGTGLSGKTTVGFYFKPENEKLAYSRTTLESVEFKGQMMGFVSVEGSLNIFKVTNEEDKKWGRGFIARAKVALGLESMEGEFEAIFQTGKVEDPVKGNFRYWFVDLELAAGGGSVFDGGKTAMDMLKNGSSAAEESGKVIGPYNLRLQGGGGGFYWNMEKLPGLNLERGDGSTPGASLSKFIYEPKKTSYGGYLTGIFSLVKQQLLALDLSLLVEVGNNDAGNMSLKKITIRGGGFMMPPSMGGRDGAPVKLGAQIELDIPNQRIAGDFSAFADYSLGVGTFKLFSLSIDSTKSKGSMLISWKDGGKFYIKAGRPNARLGAELSTFGLDFSVGNYFQIGQDIDPIPNVNEIVPGWPVPAEKAKREIDPNNGLCFGLNYNLRKSFDMAIFYAAVEGGFGFDVALGTTNQKCDDRRFGLNGWMVKGQIFAYVGADVGLQYNLGFKKGKVSVMNCSLAAMLRGQFPNPSLFNGQLAGKYSVLGGLVEGSFNLKFRLASEKDIACLNSVLSNPNAALADLPIVADKYPSDDENKDIPIFANPKLVYNLNVGHELVITDVDVNGDEITRYFKPVLDPTEGFLLKKGTTVIPCEMVAEAKSTKLKPLKMLEPLTSYTMSYKIKWQEKKNDKWEFMTGTGATEEGSISFKTGKLPDVIVSEFLDYHAPGRNQRYWHPGYASTRIKFDKAAPPGTDWQQQYFPQSKQVPNYGNVNYDYVVRLSRYDAAGNVEEVQDVPLSEYPGLKNFQIPVTEYIQVGTQFIIPTVKIQNAQGLNVGFAGLNDIITTDQKWKGKLCQLQLMRLPILPKTTTAEQKEAKTETGATAGLGEGESAAFSTINVSKTKLASNEGKIPAEYGVKVLYEYWFATSKYDNLNEKLAASSVQSYKSNVKRTDYNHPDDKTELNFSFKTTDQAFPGFTDDYFGFKNSTEGFDQFDLDRIRLNAVVTYPEAFYLKDKLWNDANGAARFAAFSQISFGETVHYDYRTIPNFNIDFGCAIGGNQLTTYNSLLNSDKALTLDNLKKYWNSRIVNPQNEQEWLGNFLLPGNGNNNLTADEITGRKLKNYSLYNGKQVLESWKGDVLSDPQSFGMIYQDQRSRILGLQYMTMRATIDKAYATAVNSAVFSNGASGVRAAAVKISERYGHSNEWNNQFWDFSEHTVTGEYVKCYNCTGFLDSKDEYAQGTFGPTQWVYTSPRESSTKVDFSPMKNWYKNVSETITGEAAAYYKGKVQINIPKLAKWQGMGQSVRSSFNSYPSYQVAVSPNRPGVSSTNGTINSNVSATNTGASAFKFSRQGADIFLDDFPRDANLVSIEIQFADAAGNFKRAAFWDGPANEVDLYDASGKRAIKYNASLPGTDGSINLSDLFNIPAEGGNTIATWSKANIYRNNNVRVLVRTNQATYTFEKNASTGLVALDNKNQSNDSRRQKAVHFSRGTGASANMLTMKMIGSAGDWDFGGCLLVDNERKQAVAHLDKNRQLTRYSYNVDGFLAATSTYTDGSPMVELDPTRNYTLYVAKAGQTEYSAALLLDKTQFWRDKVGQFFEEGTFGEANKGTVDPLGVVAYPRGTSAVAVPGKVEAENYALPNLPMLNGNGVAYKENNLNNNTFYRPSDGVGITKDQEDIIVYSIETGYWFTYKIKVQTAGKYILDIRGRANGTDRKIDVELDGKPMAGSPVTLKQTPDGGYWNPWRNAPMDITRLENFDLPAGEHTLKLKFTGEFNLDYLQFKAFAPDIEIKGNGLEILDNSTGFNSDNGTDFGNQPCEAAPKVFTIKNKGAGSLRLTGNPTVKLSGTNAADFRVVRFPSIISLEENAADSFAIQFFPTDKNLGERTATVTVESNAKDMQKQVFTFNIKATNNPVEVELRAGSNVLVSSAAQPQSGAANYFGKINQQTTVREFTLFNLGKYPMKASFNLEGDAAGEYSLQNFPTELAAGKSQNFTVTYTAASDKMGVRNAALKIQTIDCDENPYQLPLYAYIPGGAISLNEFNDFVSVPANDLLNHDFTLEAWVNVSPERKNGYLFNFDNPATIDHISLSFAGGPTGKPQLVIDNGGGVQGKWEASDKLPLNEWAHLALTVQGTTGRIFVNGNPSPPFTIVAPVNVSRYTCKIGSAELAGTAQFDEFRIWGMALSEAEIRARMNCELKGDEYGLKLYYPFNQGFAGGDNTSFTNVNDGRADGDMGGSLNWSVQRIGTKSNWVTGRNYLEPKAVCTDQFPQISLESATGKPIFSTAAASAETDFGMVKAGESKSLTFTIKNPGGKELQLTGQPKITVVGKDASQFQLSPDFQTASIPADGSAKFTVQYAPIGTGFERSATLSFAHNAQGGGSFMVNLRGEVETPGLALSFNEVGILDEKTGVSASDGTEFGTQALSSETTRNFSIKNTGNFPLIINSVTVGQGSTATDFTVKLPELRTVPPGQTTTFPVIFKPTKSGQQKATVSIKSNLTGPAADWTFAVAGTGSNPANTLAFAGDDYLEIPQPISLENDFAVEAWVNIKSYKKGWSILQFNRENSTDKMALVSNDGAMYLETTLNGVKQSTYLGGGASTGEWTHLALTARDGQVYFYAHNSNCLGNSNSPCAVFSQALPVPKGNFKCQIGAGNNFVLDEFRLWNRWLSVDEVAAHLKCELKGDENGLAVYYDFNQGVPSGDNAAISISTNKKLGVGNNGVLKNFALAGANSNWVTSENGVTKGQCLAYIANPFAVSKPSPLALIPTGSKFRDFSATPLNNEIRDTLQIENLTATALTMNLTLLGFNKQDFLLSPSGEVSIPAKGKIPVVVSFRPTSLGDKDAQINIAVAGQTSNWTSSLSGTGTPSGTALDFTGNNDYLQVPSGDYFKGDFTIEFYVKDWYTWGQPVSLLDFGDGQGNRIQLRNFPFPTLVVTKNNVPSAFGGNDYEILKGWHHVAVSVSGNSGKIYLDGDLANSFTVDAPRSSIWNNNSLGKGCYLKLDEFRIWGRGLSQNEIRARKNCELKGDEDGLLLYYDFNQGIPSSRLDTQRFGFAKDKRQGGNKDGALVDFDGVVGQSNWIDGGSPASGVCTPYQRDLVVTGGNPVLDIPNGSPATTTNGTDFGYLATSKEMERQFEIENTAASSVTISGIAAGGDFVASQPLQTSLQPGEKTSFTIKFNPATPGSKQATVSIQRSLPGEWKFNVTGVGMPLVGDIKLAVEGAKLNTYKGLNGDNVTSQVLQNASIGTPISNHSTLDMGEAKAGISPVFTLRIDNKGAKALNLTGSPKIQLSGLDAAQFSVTNWYDETPFNYAEILAEGSQNFNVKFQPSGAFGNRSATLTILSDDPDESSFTVQLKGKFVASSAVMEVKRSGSYGYDIPEPVSLSNNAPAGSLTDFGDVNVTLSKDMYFKILADPTKEPLVLTGAPKAILSGPNAEEFTADFYENFQGITLHVSFKPTGQQGARTASITIPNSDPSKSNFVINVKGNAMPSSPEIDVVNSQAGGGIASGGTADFGVVEPDATKDFNFSLRNTGDGPLHLTGSPKLAISGADANQFKVTSDVNSNSIEAVYGSASFSIRFTPNGGGGTRNATLTIANDDPNEGAYTVQLKALVGSPEIDVQFGGNSVFIANSNNDASKVVDLGTIGVGGSNSAIFTIKNTGNAALKFAGNPKIVVNGTDASQFTVEPAFTSISIPANGSADFTVKFAPKAAAGMRTATLTIPNNDPDEGSYVVKLKGTGIAPDLSVKVNGGIVASGGTVDFGGISSTGATKDIVFTLMNNGSAPLNMSLKNNGRLIQTAYFYQSINLTNTTIAPNSSVEVSVRFNPKTLTQDFSDIISIISNDPDGAYTINLKGKGVLAPEIDVVDKVSNYTSNSLASGSTITNTFFNKNERSFTYYIKNTGSKELSLLSDPKVMVSGTDAARVTVVSVTATSVAVGGEQGFTFKFLPTASKVHEFTLTIPNDDADEGNYILNFKFTVQ